MPPTCAKIRDDLLYYPDPEDESRQFVKDPIRRQFFKYNELQIEMMKALDGKRTVEDVRALLKDQFDADVPATAIDRFISRLDKNLLLDLTSYTVDDEKTRQLILKHLRARNLALRVKARDSATREGQLFEAGTRELLDGDPCKAAVHLQAVLDLNPNNERARQVLIATHEAFFKTKVDAPSHAKLVHILNPDRFLGVVDRAVGRFVFSGVGLIFVLAVIVSGIAPFWSVVSEPRLLEFKSSDILVFLITGNVMGAFHELSHGLACKHYGGRVDDVGWMFIYGVMPGFYCDTSDTYLFSGRRPKIVVQVAGGLGALFNQALVYHLLTLTDPSFPLWHGIAFASLSSLPSSLNNLIPLVKFDAYYALVDYLGITNLRERSFAYLRDKLQLWTLGILPHAEPPVPRERRIFLVFGVLACVYTVFFIYGIYVSLLLPLAVEHLGIVGVVIAGLYFANLLGRQIVGQVVRFLAAVVRHRKTVFTPGRTLAYVVVVGGIIAGLAAPWPFDVGGTLELEPIVRAEIRAGEAGLVDDILVKEGDRVEVGQLLAVLRADELIRDRALAAQDQAIARNRLELLRKGARPEEIMLASAQTYAGRVKSAAADGRVSEARKLQALDVGSTASLDKARAQASHAGGEVRVSVAQAAVDLAGARIEELAESEADVRRWQVRLDDLDARIARLEIRSPVGGVVMTSRLDEQLGKRVETGHPVLEIHDTSRWRGRIVPARGEPLSGLAVGQKIVLAAEGDPHHRVETTVHQVLPPADANSSVVVYTAPFVQGGWRSGMTGQARIHAPRRSVAYRLIVLPITRLIDFELPSL